MSRFRKVDTRIWNDAKFRDLSDTGKLVFFMLLTHPGMTALGAMRATLPGLAAEMGWQSNSFGKAFEEASRLGLVEHDDRACLVTLPNFLKYNRPESPNVVKAWVAAVDMLPECALKERVIARANACTASMTEGFGKAFQEAFGEALAKGMPNQEQEQEQKQEQAIDSLRSSSSSGDDPTQGSKVRQKGERLAQVTDEAIAAYNAILAAPAGVLPVVTRAGREKRQSEVKRCLRVVRRICQEQYGSTVVTPAFWKAYFDEVARDDFKAGRQVGGRGHENWKPGFEYLTREATVLEVFERAMSEVP